MVNGLSVIATLTVFFVVSEVSAKCCGRGKNGYCNDCAPVGLTLRRKCCGVGSGHGHGCNILCCNCGDCRSGHPNITFKSGWFLRKKYACRRYKDSASANIYTLQDTWDVFNKIDKNADASVSPDEFLQAMRLRLSNDENALITASHLLDSREVSEVASFLDAVNDEEMEMSDEEDFARMVADEFEKLDQDGDGLIQAGEFDDDLKDESKKDKKNAKTDLVRELISKLQ